MIVEVWLGIGAILAPLAVAVAAGRLAARVESLERTMEAWLRGEEKRGREVQRMSEGFARIEEILKSQDQRILRIEKILDVQGVI